MESAYDPTSDDPDHVAEHLDAAIDVAGGLRDLVADHELMHMCTMLSALMGREADVEDVAAAHDWIQHIDANAKGRRRRRSKSRSPKPKRKAKPKKPGKQPHPRPRAQKQQQRGRSRSRSRGRQRQQQQQRGRSSKSRSRSPPRAQQQQQRSRSRSRSRSRGRQQQQQGQGRTTIIDRSKNITITPGARGGRGGGNASPSSSYTPTPQQQPSPQVVYVPQAPIILPPPASTLSTASVSLAVWQRDVNALVSFVADDNGVIVPDKVNRAVWERASLLYAQYLNNRYAGANLASLNAILAIGDAQYK